MLCDSLLYTWCTQKVHNFSFCLVLYLSIYLFNFFFFIAYRYHLAMDPNPDVRRAVLTNTAITFQTLPDILERTRDVRDLVRRQVGIAEL